MPSNSRLYQSLRFGESLEKLEASSITHLCEKRTNKCKAIKRVKLCYPMLLVSSEEKYVHSEQQPGLVRLLISFYLLN